MQVKSLRIIISSLGIGGTERHICQVLPRLVKKGWQVKVVNTGRNNALAPELEKAGIKVITFSKSSSKVLQIGRVLHGLWGEFRADRTSLTHFFLPQAYIFGMFSAILAGFKGVKLMSRRSLNNYQRKIKCCRWLESKLHKRTDLVLGISQAVIDQLRIQENVPPNHLRLIYNGIDLVPFQKIKNNKIRTLLGVKDSSLVLTVVANLIPYKGHTDLLEALSYIKQQLPRNWRLLCAGYDGGILEKLKTQAHSLGISNNVLWLGSRQDVGNILAASDIGILCSHQEGLGNSILECMAAALPMIVTDVGGIPEVVVHQKTGLVVPAKSPKKLSEAIIELSSDPKKMQSFGKAGKKRVEQSFSIDKCVSEYHDLYQSFCSGTN